MKPNSLLAIGIILVCLFYLSGDIYTLLSYIQMLQTEEEPALNFGPSPFMVYTFAGLLLLKILLLLKASVVADFLLPGQEEVIPGISMNNVLLITGILLIVVALPDLIMAVARYKKSVEYIDDPFKSFNEKLDIYDSGLRLVFASALIYWRKDILSKLLHKSE